MSTLDRVTKPELVSTELPLENELHERFVWVYVFGSDSLGLDTEPPVLPGNAAAAYRCVRPDVGESSVRSQASKLLRRGEVLDRIVELKEERDRQIKARAAGFVPLYERAIQTLDEIRRGIWRPESMEDLDARTIPQMARIAYLAATEITGRVLGSVTQQHEVTQKSTGFTAHVLTWDSLSPAAQAALTKDRAQLSP